MILVTVGTQLAFDRLVRAVDGWAAAHPGVEVFAQIGPSRRPPRHMQWETFVGPDVLLERARTCSLIVAHAGIGSILTALELGKPLIVLPRRADLGEVRSDHQLAMVARLRAVPGVHVADDEAALYDLLERRDGLARPDGHLGPWASPELLATVSDFVNAAGRRALPGAKILRRVWHGSH